MGQALVLSPSLYWCGLVDLFLVWLLISQTRVPAPLLLHHVGALITTLIPCRVGEVDQCVIILCIVCICMCMHKVASL